MTDHEKLDIEPTLKLHKQFLQNLLQEIMKVFETGDPSVDRMIRGLRTYWDANIQYGATRRTVQAALADTPYENGAETMGRPFQMMLQAELQASKVQDIGELSAKIYKEARAISVAEALSDKPDHARREQLIKDIFAATQKTS